LSIRPLGVSVLDAIAVTAEGNGKIITAVTVGKRHAASSSFELMPDGPEPLSKPVLQSDDDFTSALATAGKASLLCCDDLTLRIGRAVPDNIGLTRLRWTIAQSIGIFAARHPERTSLVPIYLRDSAVKTRTIA
jgi:hypothetical protein